MTIPLTRNPSPLRRRVPFRAAMLATAGAGLVTGVWSGLVRAGWAIPSGGVVSPAIHGVLMVSGFFGSLIALERAVALDRNWAYVGVPAAALGALGMGVGLPGAGWWSLLAALILTLGSVQMWRSQPSTFMAVMSFGALSWFLAIVVQLRGGSIDQQVPWFVAFLVGVIVGERLELSRLAAPSKWKMPTFSVAIAAFLVGVVGAWMAWDTGWRLLGAALLALAAWLGVFDVARRTVRVGGVTRFIGICLLSGYAWLAVAGAWWMIGGDLAGSLGRDGAMHSVFVGFVLSMVFGHVFMVAPAVIGLAVPFRTWFGGHLLLLHASLILRVVGDLASDWSLRRLGALGNAVALAAFVIGTVFVVAGARPKQRAQ